MGDTQQLRELPDGPILLKAQDCEEYFALRELGEDLPDGVELRLVQLLRFHGGLLEQRLEPFARTLMSGDALQGDLEEPAPMQGRLKLWVVHEPHRGILSDVVRIARRVSKQQSQAIDPLPAAF